MKEVHCCNVDLVSANLQIINDIGKHKDKATAPEWGAVAVSRSGASVRVFFVEGDFADMFDAIRELGEDLRHGILAIESEDVAPMSRRVVEEVNESEESAFAFGAYSRIVGEVGEVGEVVLFDAIC